MVWARAVRRLGFTSTAAAAPSLPSTETSAGMASRRVASRDISSPGSGGGGRRGGEPALGAEARAEGGCSRAGSRIREGSPGRNLSELAPSVYACVSSPPDSPSTACSAGSVPRMVAARTRSTCGHVSTTAPPCRAHCWSPLVSAENRAKRPTQAAGCTTQHAPPTADHRHM
eukprot:1043081-Prorocentrum_minimum.AAC.2